MEKLISRIIANLYKVLSALENMKKVMLGFFLTVFLIGIVSAAHECGNDVNQVILRLSGNTNAHGEIATESNYHGTGRAVCYAQTFGTQFVGIVDRTCNGNSKVVLKLSSSTNAHAEGPAGTSYGVSVCYTGLTCTLETGSCTQGRREVVRLSAPTNAHLEMAGESNYANPSIVCCSIEGVAPPPPPPAGGRAYWADVQGIEFNNNDPVYQGVPIMLIAEGVPVSTKIDFEIFDKDLIGDDNIRAIRQVGDVNGDGKVETTVTFNPTDFSKGIADESSENPLEIELYFIATGSSYSQQSKQIRLLATEPPIVQGCAAYNNDVFVQGLSGSPTKEDACNGDIDDQLKKDKNYNNVYNKAGCGGIYIDENGVEREVLCLCSWVPVNGGSSNECILSSTLKELDDDPADPLKNCDFGICNIHSTSPNGCFEGFEDIIVEAEFIDGTCTNTNDPAKEGCASYEDKVLCSSPTLELSFFGIGQFILSIGAIAIIYLFIIIRRKGF